MNSTTIPALPCESMDEMLIFYQAIGFEVTYKQKAPNPYAVVHHADEYDLHFFWLKQLKSEDNFSTCLIVVPEVENLHAQFVEKLKSHLGKIPSKGFPRISRMKPKQTRFTLTDVAGNSIIYIKRGKEDEEKAQEYLQSDQTSLQKALSTAARLRDFKNDDKAAAKVLDTVLAREGQGTLVEYAKVLIARIDLAVALDEIEKAREIHARLKILGLSDPDKLDLKEELIVLNDLEKQIF
jgi:hypothetical protein